LSLFLLLAIGEQATQSGLSFFLFSIGTEMNRYGGMDMGMEGRNMGMVRYGTGVGTDWNDWLGGLVIGILYCESVTCVV